MMSVKQLYSHTQPTTVLLSALMWGTHIKLSRLLKPAYADLNSYEHIRFKHNCWYIHPKLKHIAVKLYTTWILDEVKIGGSMQENPLPSPKDEKKILDHLRYVRLQEDIYLISQAELTWRKY